MRSFRFKKNGGGVETAVQGNRQFSIIPTTTSQFLAKVVEKEGKRQNSLHPMFSRLGMRPYNG